MPRSHLGFVRGLQRNQIGGLIALPIAGNWKHEADSPNELEAYFLHLGS